ncbi:1,3-beta-glucanase, partial [Streptomyces sp. NPDC127044]
MSEPSGTPVRRGPLRRVILAAVGTLTLAVAAVLPANASAPTPPARWSHVFVGDFNGAGGARVHTSHL